MNLRTPITYYGGKQSMLKVILPKIPEHRIYCEPFFGGGAVFFAKKPSYLEVINDNNDRLMVFYEEMQNNFPELEKLISNTLHSESQYKKARQIFNGRVEASRVELAWSVWVLSNMSFSGSFHGGWKWCNGSSGSHSGRYICKKSSQFELLKDRLNKVQISCRDALEIIKKRDTPETFFYIDSPYPGFSQKHYSGYTITNLVELLTVLEVVKGKFLLSNFWSQTLKYFIAKNNWYVEKHKKANKVANFKTPREKVEILVSNYDYNFQLFNK